MTKTWKNKQEISFNENTAQIDDVTNFLQYLHVLVDETIFIHRSNMHERKESFITF